MQKSRRDIAREKKAGLVESKYDRKGPVTIHNQKRCSD